MTEGLAKKKGRGSFLRIAKDENDLRPAGGKRRPGAEGKTSTAFDDVSESFDFPDSPPGGKKPKRARRETPRSERGSAKSRLVPVLALGLLAILVAGAIAILPGALLLRKVVVAGTTSLAAADVVAASGVKPGKPLLSNDLGLVERNLEAWAPVASAKASYILPDALRLEIVERKAVALVLVEEGQTMVPVSIDSQGYAFAKASPADAVNLPLLSGIRFDAWKPGMRLPAYLLPTVGSIAALGGKDPTLLSLFSELRVERTNWGEVELVLFPLHHAIPVRTGPKLDAALLRSIVLVLDALDKGGIAPKVGELDFRSGTIVFRSKEGSPG
ncbi:MAG TPA: FtsQ-type POTRA domain-containing protein [Rectinemataceae bacterium]|nr:FtsQ-type POTRA domain-containing protein [Rectinemataceae bacterium]